MCSALGHVRFTPNSDRESRHPQTVMSAVPPKADMCGAARDVRYGPIADMGQVYSITSSALACNDNGTVRPRVLAVLRFMMSWNFAGCCTGRSVGVSPLRMRFT